MSFAKWVKNNRDALLIALFLGITLSVSGLIGYLKYHTLYAWGYTSDLFTFDTVLAENLRGHFGLEFTFGNTFGDHAEPFLVLLVPLKLLLQTKMVDFLILFAPIGLFFASTVMFFAMRSAIGVRKAFLLTLSLVFGFSFVIRGSFEKIYGFHPDTFSGFVAIAFTSFLIWFSENQSQGRKAKFQFVGFWMCFVGYLSLKEEMALLGLVYFLIAMVFRPNRLHITALLLAVLAFGVGYLTILAFQTPFNRTNTVLLSGVIEGVRTNGFRFFIENPGGDPNAVIVYWVIVISGLAYFTINILWIRTRNLYATCLFGAGLAKMILSFLAIDFNIYAWHNFPGLMMMISAFLWQISLMDRPRFLKASIFPALVLLVSITGFLGIDLPFYFKTIATNRESAQAVEVYNSELAEIKQSVPSDRVVAIPAFSVIQWVGYRFSFYPRGLSMSPVAIADYTVYPKNVEQKFTNGSDRALPLDEIKPDFQRIRETPHFILLKRTAVNETEQDYRETFYHLFGMESNLPLP